MSRTSCSSTPWAAISAISNLIEIVAQSVLLIRWREWMADEYSRRWLQSGTHYRISLAGTADNPDQRIAEDCRIFLAGAATGHGSEC